MNKYTPTDKAMALYNESKGPEYASFYIFAVQTLGITETLAIVSHDAWSKGIIAKLQAGKDTKLPSIVLPLWQTLLEEATSSRPWLHEDLPSFVVELVSNRNNKVLEVAASNTMCEAVNIAMKKAERLLVQHKGITLRFA